MFGSKRIICAGGRAAAISLGAVILATVLTWAAFAAPTAGETAATSPKVHDLLTSLAEEWLKEQGTAKPAAPPLGLGGAPAYAKLRPISLGCNLVARFGAGPIRQRAAVDFHPDFAKIA